MTQPESAGPERKVDGIQSVTLTFDAPLDDATIHAKATTGMIVYRLPENRRYVAGRQNARDVPLDEYLIRQREHSKGREVAPTYGRRRQCPRPVAGVAT